MYIGCVFRFVPDDKAEGLPLMIVPSFVPNLLATSLLSSYSRTFRD